MILVTAVFSFWLKINPVSACINPISACVACVFKRAWPIHVL